MATTRRTFLRTSSLAALAAAGNPLALTRGTAHKARSGRPDTVGMLPRATDPELKVLAQRALDAAQAGGASYADVRFTVTRFRTFHNAETPTDREVLAVGVRALANGAWGFAAHTDWDADTVAQLGQKAAVQAVVDAWPRVPPITLTDHPSVATGHWATPVRRDPFTVPEDEVRDLIAGVWRRVMHYKAGMDIVLMFQRQDRAFVSTDGAYATQTIYTSLGGSPHSSTPPSQLVITAQGGRYTVPLITPTGAGYEAVEDAKLADHVDEWIAKAQALNGAKRFGRLNEYDVVFDGAAMAAIVDGTFGTPLEYDRAVGYEANAGGTSYLAPPSKVLGTQHAPELVTITADRTLPRGTATVRWDDEGVTPVPTPLVKEGVVVDYATSREFVAELAPWYRQHGRPLRSNGCVASESAFTVPLVYTPNLVLSPGAPTTSFTDLVAQVDDGYAVLGGTVHMDIQGLTGRGTGAEVYEIKHGKLGEPVQNATYLFHSQELWKRLKTLGGAGTAMMRGLSTSKGQPDQGTVHSVQAVAAHFERVQMYDSSSI
jgi:TldD protein